MIKRIKNLWLWFCIACLMFSAVCMLSGCASNLGGSYTRLYPVTDYMIKDDGVEAVYTLENNGEGSGFFKSHRVYLHDGEDTVIVISADRDGKGFDGVKEYYLYLNEDKVVEWIKDKGGS